MMIEKARIRHEAVFVAGKLWNALEALRQQSVALVIELSHTREDRYFLGFLLAKGFVESGIRGISCKRLQAIASADELSVLIIPALGGETREMMIERSATYLASRPDFCNYVRNNPRRQRRSDPGTSQPDSGVPEVQTVQWPAQGRAVSRRARRSGGRTGWDNTFPV